jgi:putative peptidoglycan lipid II flippase
MVGDSMSGALWTVVSRLTGLGKVVAVGAVLGATYVGNTYQAINSLPNLVYYQLLAGTLFVSLLVPPMVRHIDQGDRRGAEKLARGFFGSVLVVALLLSGAILVAGHLILRLLTIGVSSHATAAAQSRVGWAFLLMFVPQICLYVIAGTSAAVMNAHGRFALAAGAPSLESLGMIVTLLVAGAVFGTATSLSSISTSQLLLLGLGTTAGVAAHAACQWLGARSTGVKLAPRIGWRDPEVRVVLRRIVPTLAFTGLAACQLITIMVVANRVSGGLVAFQLGLNFFYLPVAIVTWPVARALLPPLSRAHNERDPKLFRDELSRGVRLASFMTLPVAVAYLALSWPLARAVAFGALRNPAGVRMVAISIVSVSIAVIGETWFIMGTYAFYAQHDARSPLRSMAVRIGVSVGLMLGAWSAHGALLLLLLGLSFSLGSLVGAFHIWMRLRARLPRSNRQTFRSVARSIVASGLMLIPALLAAVVVRSVSHSHLMDVMAMLAASLVGFGTFFAIQSIWRAPEIAMLKAGFLRGRPGSSKRARAS